MDWTVDWNVIVDTSTRTICMCVCVCVCVWRGGGGTLLFKTKQVANQKMSGEQVTKNGQQTKIE